MTENEVLKQTVKELREIIRVLEERLKNENQKKQTR